ncbi:hypothetical protein [Streptomyces sp. NPDC091268]|uniref:hypothetical protein n=1 Tax=Streptomyces sp. NPDC091268 TaxID=3365979 RepID=UPI00382132C6
MGTTAWHEHVTNGDPLGDFFEGAPPPLARVRVRSVHPDGWGQAVVLRIDLPRERAGDTVQCHLNFLAVRDFRLDRWEPPATADITLSPVDGTGAEQRLAVDVRGERIALAFDAYRGLQVTRVSRYRGTESGPREWAGPVERRLYPVLPPTTARTFYEHP